jgi:hypothetical protein
MNTKIGKNGILAAALLAGAAAAYGQPAATAVIYDTQPVSGFATTGPSGGSTAPLQTIDAVATGTGAVDPAVLAAMDGMFINSLWEDAAGTRFARVETMYQHSRNYLAFTEGNANGVKAAIRFSFFADGMGDQWAGGFNNGGPRIVIASGQSYFIGAVLDRPQGSVEITFGSYTGEGTVELGFNYRTGPEDGKAYAARAAGFVVSGVADGKTVTATFRGVDGQVLSVLEATSAGETVAGENAAGGELFFGYDAGEDPANWIHSIELGGETGGNAGFDDFGFTPVAVVDAQPTGPRYGGFPVEDGNINVPHMGWVYVGEAPWLYVWARNAWIFAPEEMFSQGGAYFYGLR